MIVSLVPPVLPNVVRLPLVAVDVGLMLVLLGHPVIHGAFVHLVADHTVVAIVFDKGSPPGHIVGLFASEALVAVVAPVVKVDSVVIAITPSSIATIGVAILVVFIPPVSLS